MKTLVFTDADLALLAEGLGHLPYSKVVALFGNINAQLANAAHTAQQAKQTAPVDPLPEVVGVPE